MLDGSLLVLDGQTVHALLHGREVDVVETVARAYRAHGRGDSSLPHSLFLRFPNAPANRIIALPAYLGDQWNAAGMKWISSFPGNIQHGADRASALLVLNSAVTGHPYAVMEASQISAQRTAASAALAARHLWTPSGASRIAVIGTGLIAYETLRFIDRTVNPLGAIQAFDLAPASAHAFAARVQREFATSDVRVVDTLADALRGADLVLFATTASMPHVVDPACFEPGSTVLHLSLRDLSPEVILACDNVVDDASHVCRAETSVHLAEQRQGNRDFIRATLADILEGTAPARIDPRQAVVFSPFGLGVLDLAVGHLVAVAAETCGLGVAIPSFLPLAWRETPTQAMA